ncbi:MAG: thiamine pyrophosphate-dependent dehydrogenase E1 component subunit alpha [Candidatus Acidiferrales bacterium]
MQQKIDDCRAGTAVADDLSWALFRKMLQVRRVEESLLQLFSRGLLFGTVHTCIGQEVCGVGVTQALNPAKDVLWSNHRGHGHYLSFTGDLQGLLSEILGKAGGACGGVGGSQHLHYRNVYTNGILGGTVPCAVGCAFAEKFKGNDAVVVVFLGDGALGEGIVYEGMNIASLWGLPVLFVLEDNGYAQSTPRSYEHSGDIETRARTFAIPTTILKADNAIDVWRATGKIVSEMRLDLRPQMLVLQTYRLAPHSKGDDNRDEKEIAAHWAADPLARHREILRAENPERLEQIEKEIGDEVQRCINVAIDDQPTDLARFLGHIDKP